MNYLISLRFSRESIFWIFSSGSRILKSSLDILKIRTFSCRKYTFYIFFTRDYTLGKSSKESDFHMSLFSLSTKYAIPSYSVAILKINPKDWRHGGSYWKMVL